MQSVLINKITALIIIFNSFFLVDAFSQSNLTTRFEFPLAFAKLIDYAPDGGFYFLGGMNADIVLGKIDSSGNLQWARKIGSSSVQELPMDLLVLNNGSAVISYSWYDGISQKTFFAGFDLSGNLTFCKRYANGTASQNNITNNLISDADGFVASISNSPINETRIVKADSLGNKIGGVYLPGNFRNIFKTSTGSYLLYHQVLSEIVSYDSSLNYMASAYTTSDYFIGNHYGMIEISEGSYLLFGESNFMGCVAKVNTQLIIEWQKIYSYSPSSPSTGKFFSAHKIDENKITLFAQGETEGNELCILTIDTLGNILNCKSIASTGINIDYCPSKTVFQNNRLTFMYNLATGIFLQNIVCFKIASVDTSFSLLCNAIDTTLSILDDNITGTGGLNYTTNSTNDSLVNDNVPIINIIFPFGSCNDTTLSINSVPIEKININIYPNPFTDLLHITAKDNMLTEVVIYDATFKKIMQHKFLNSISINTTELSKGIYIYEARNENGHIKSGKISKL